VVVAVRQTVGDPELARSNPALERRMDQAREELVRGWDRWTQRFADLDPVAQRSTVEWEQGLARMSLHSAVAGSVAAVQRFFAAEGMQVGVDTEGRIAELTLVAAGSMRATASEERRFREKLGSWSEAVAAYLNAAAELYAHLEQAPERAVPCFAHVFDRHGPESGPLDDREEAMVTDLNDAVDEVVRALSVEGGEDKTLNELSRLVHDPFPVRLTATVHGRVLEVEGFEQGDGFLERPTRDLWGALRALEGRWLAPDIVTAVVAPGPAEAQPETDPVEFATRPRSLQPSPSAQEVGEAVTAELELDVECRVSWRRPNVEADPEGENGDGRTESPESLATIEASLPPPR
jgi:hypothetical protein